LFDRFNDDDEGDVVAAAAADELEPPSFEGKANAEKSPNEAV
jgi:hypothetical protein